MTVVQNPPLLTKLMKMMMMIEMKMMMKIMMITKMTVVENPALLTNLCNANGDDDYTGDDDESSLMTVTVSLHSKAVH